MDDMALDDLKILDFSWVAAGPHITKTLADFGATVVRLESINRPCTMRIIAPYKDGIPGVNRGLSFLGLNANKYSMALDLKHVYSKEIVKRLVIWCDVVVENFTAGTMEELGLGYDELKKIKSDIIMIRSSNQGQTGPHSKHPGYGIQLMGLAGIPHFTGEIGGVPTPLPVAYTDVVAPPFCTIALIAALDHRNRTGKGQMIDVSQLETAMHFLGPAILDCDVNKNRGGRQGNQSPSAAPHSAFRCKGDDRWCVVAIFNDEQWKALCNILSDSQLAYDTRFNTFMGRKKHESELNSIIESWTIDRTPEDVMKLMQSEGIPAGIVQNGQDLRSDPQLNHRDMFWQLEHTELGLCTHRGQSIHMSKTPARGRMAAPCLGEHTEYVCREILKMDDSEFVELFNLGVFT